MGEHPSRETRRLAMPQFQMDNENGGFGIQALLEAENQAKDMVKHANTERQTKMKAAREHAAQEIADYKSERETSFLAYKKEHSTDAGGCSAKLQAQTDAAVSDLQSVAAANRPKAIALLVQYVTTVKS